MAPFSLHLSSMLASFWVHVHSILAPVWVHLGSILNPCWLHLAVLGGSRGGCPNCPPNSLILGPRWGPFGHQFHKKSVFFDQKMHHLFDRSLIAFWIHFGILLGSILHEKTSLGRKRWFYQNGRFVYTRAQFFKVRASQKPSKKHPKMHWKKNNFHGAKRMGK